MKLFKSMFILLVSGIISTAKADENIDHNILYYAFKSCVGIKKCELSIPVKKMENIYLKFLIHHMMNFI
jgi:hypothetical protein